jgi:hypothetical protein
LEELIGWADAEGHNKNRDSHNKEGFHVIHHRKRWNRDLL